MGGNSGGGGNGGRSGGGGEMSVADMYGPIKSEYSAKGVSVGLSKGMNVAEPGQKPRYGDVIGMRARNGADARIYSDRVIVSGKKYTDFIAGLTAFEKDARI